jgi:hypothetical protein
MTQIAELADRLDAIAEEIADLALDRLRAATGGNPGTAAPDPTAVADERRFTRARRAVEKAAAVLRGVDEER